MPGLGSLVSAIRPISKTKRGEVYLIPAGNDGRPAKEAHLKPRKLQYFPASIQSTKGVSYQAKEVPGGSLPIYQWTNSGEHQVSFVAYFSTDVDHFLIGKSEPMLGAAQTAKNAVSAVAADGDTATTYSKGLSDSALARLKAAGATDRNVFIPGALLWLRSFLMPTYATSATTVGAPLTFAPRKLWLVIPNSGVDLIGGDGGFSGQNAGMFCHMSQCDITYEALFPSGNPRVVQVALTFVEDAQQGGAVRFPQVGRAMQKASEKWYTLEPSGGTKK